MFRVREDAPKRGCGGCAPTPLTQDNRAMADVLDDAGLRARGLPHSSHWGAFSVLVRDREIEVVPHPRDAAPSSLLGNIPASVAHAARIAQPMIRRGWLERRPG